MKADLKKALDELAQAYDEFYALPAGTPSSPLEVSIDYRRARDRIATVAYAVDKAYRPKYYKKLEAWKEGR